MLEIKFNIQMFADGGEKKFENKQSEIDIDAKIAEALAKATKNFEETLKKREVKLSDDERQKAEIINEKNFQRRNLPVEFTEYLIAEDNESTLKRITTFEKKFKAAVEAEVNERLKGKAPQSGNKNTSGNTPRAKDDTLKVILANQVKRG